MRTLTKLSFTPTIDTSAYAAADVLHSAAFVVDLTVLRDHPDLWLDEVVLVDKAKQSAALDLALFSADVASQTLNTPFAPTDTEAATCVSWLPITTYSIWNVNSVAIASGLRRSLVLDPAGAMKLYGFLISRGTPTYGAATDLVLTLKFIALGENR